MSSGILFSVFNHLGLITLNKPQSLNALSFEMIQAIQRQLSAWKKDSTIHAVVMNAVPGKAFCAGGDIRSLYEHKNDKKVQALFFWHEYRLNYDIATYPKPYVALMDGITMGGGVGISLHGSHPVASERFVFAMPETGIGFFPDIGASSLLMRTPGQLGFYLGLTGNRLNAFEAHHAKLVFDVVESAAFDSLLNALAEEDLSMMAYERVGACINKFAKSYSTSDIELDYSKIDRYFFSESMLEMMSGLDRANDPWASSTYEQLLQKSPLSLFVTLKQLAKAKYLNLGECLKMDYCLVQHFMANSDFYEGVRALIIDKDKNPKWQYKTIKDVPMDAVNTFFEMVDDRLEFL